MTRIGIVGGGQLGRMLALAGYPLGLTCTVLEPAAESSAAQVCPRIRGEYDDLQKLYELAQHSEVVTYEFENVPVEAARWLAERVEVYPPPAALEVAQERVREKTFFRDLGVPVPAFAAVETRAEFDAALATVGLPAVLKTTRFGYDGKGQATLRTPAEAEAAWARLGGRPLILEEMVAFDRELSLVAARSALGEAAFYPLVENRHRDGMLRLTLAPAPGLAPQLQPLAERYVGAALRALDYVGVLAVEFFERGGELLVNEMAPRVHNSGHWTTEGAETSQFENHLRAVLGLPLGPTMPRGHSAMANLIGTMPVREAVLALPGAHLHHYGKAERAGRKLGHVTLTAETAAGRDALLDEWRRLTGAD